MKVYIVTCGCYSDYHIVKVFTNKDKAEEFREWHTGWDGGPAYVEEYETEDDLIVDKYYKIKVKYTWYDNGDFVPSVKFTKYTSQQIDHTHYDEGEDRRGRYYELTLLRYVNAQNYDEEFYTNKYKKAAYDLAAIVRMKKAEGASKKDIREMFESGV